MEYLIQFLSLFTVCMKIAVASSTANIPQNAVADVIQTSLENLESRHTRSVDIAVTNSSMGRCNMTHLATLTGMCTGLLYKPYRMKTGQTCRSQVPEMSRCVQRIYDICLEGIFNLQQLVLAKTVAAFSFSVPAVQKLLCDDAGVNRAIPSTLVAICNATMTANYSLCYQNFHQFYDQDRGDPRLCGQYETSSSCLITSLEMYCNSTAVEMPIKQAREAMIRKANPFCSIAQGAGDPSTFYSGSSGRNSSTGSLGVLITLFAILLSTYTMQ